MVNWTAENQAKLFVAYMKCHEVKSVNLAGMAEFMGDGCTPKAISHQIAALKKKAGAGTTTTISTPKRAQASAPTTPRHTPQFKVSKSTPSSTRTKTKLSSTKKRARKDENDDEAEASAEEDEEEGEVKMKNYDELESDHESGGRAVDRTPVRRSGSAAVGRYVGMDESEPERGSESEDEDGGAVLTAKRVKMESEA